MNAMHNATCQFTLLDSRTVLFHIDLNSHVHLRDPALVESCMADFMSKYPKVSSWEATASGDDLNIIVCGDINLSSV